MTKLYYFRETRLFVWKIETFGELKLPYSSMVFAEILCKFSSWQYTQKGIWDLILFYLGLELLIEI